MGSVYIRFCDGDYNSHLPQRDPRMRLRKEVRYEIAFKWRLKKKMVGFGSWSGEEFLEHWGTVRTS